MTMYLYDHDHLKGDVCYEPCRCSVAGHYVTPLNDFHFYTATKFAVTALCEGIRHELRQIKSNMRVSVSLRREGIFYVPLLI